MKDFLKKIQDLPEGKRKIIFWIIIIFLGIIFLSGWIYSLKARLEAIKGQRIIEQLKPPKFEEELKMPQIETPKFPEISEEELKKLEEELKKAEEQTQ